jgi:HEPN domain-containing protein
MKEDIAEWIKIAEDNLNTAELLYQNEKFLDASYYCQQVAEKSFKAVQVYKLKRFDKIHDLHKLAESVKAPTSILRGIEKLDRYYVATRYPALDDKMNVNEEDVEVAISAAKEVLEWAKSTLKY